MAQSLPLPLLQLLFFVLFLLGLARSDGSRMCVQC
jgi:hypothetical protein